MLRASRCAPFLALLLALAGAAPASADDPVGRVRGTVRNLETGVPVAFTRLTFYDSQWRNLALVTVGDGAFISPDLPIGPYFVFVERSGNLASQFYDGLPCIRRTYDRFTCDRTQARVVEVLEGATTEIAIAMRPGATFRGKIQDRATQAALPGAFASLRSADLDDLDLYSYVDETGDFLIEGIPPGNYLLQATATHYPQELWPAVTCVSHNCDAEKPLATLFSVEGDEVLAGLDFSLGKYGRVTGQVRDRQTGLPIRSAQILLQPTELPSGRGVTAVTGDDGRFENSRVPPLAYYAQVEENGYRSQVYRGVDLAAWQADPSLAEVVTLPPGGLASLDFELTPLPAIRVRVIQPSGGSACELQIWRRDPGGAVHVVDNRTCRDGVERKYLLPGPGDYLLVARGDFASTLVGAGSCYYEEWQNYCDFSRATAFTVAADQVFGPVEIRPEAAATLHVSARDARTQTPIAPQYLLEDDQGRPISRFEKLPPGRYYLAALGVPGHENRVYPDLPCGRFYCDPQTAQPIELLPGADFATTFELAALEGRTCDENESRLCVQQDRFEIVARWQNFAGAEGEARLLPLGSESGYAYFFSPSNVELMVKVLNACSPELGERFWVFAAGLTNVAVDFEVKDTWTGLTQSYRNPIGQIFAPVFDTTTFTTCGAAEPVAPAPPFPAAALQVAELPAAQAASSAAPADDPAAIEYCQSPPNCIAGRFRPTVTYTAPGDSTGVGDAHTLTPDTKAYTFFSADNYEVLIKVLDACETYGQVWFFASGLTDLPVTIHLRDQATFRNYYFGSPGGQPFQPIFDLQTLPCVPPLP